MSGHSRWATIKRKKSAADQKRGREFSKLIRALTAAAKHGGGDPNQNVRLRGVYDQAKAINMPVDTINRAISRGAGDGDSTNIFELTYEGYGPSGVAILIETITENKNRTAAEVRHLLSKHGGALGESGCVMWMFTKKGIIIIDKAGVDEEALTDAAIENGADDVIDDGDSFTIVCAPSSFEGLKTALTGAGFTLGESEISMEPQTTVKLEQKAAETVLKLVDALEEHDDVQNVYSNFDISAEIMEKISL